MDLGSNRTRFSNLENSTKDAESFYDCRICMDVAADPVVTCCGHLFCWSCLYRWLNTGASLAKQCPICKGEVAVQNLTPINGCGGNGQKPEINTSLRVPPRPQARRVESMKESIRKEGFALMEELIRRLSQKYDLAEIYSYGTGQDLQGSSSSANSFLSRVLTSRGMRGEHSNVPSPNEAACFYPTNTLAATFTSAFPSTEDLVGSDFTTNPEMSGNDFTTSWFRFAGNDNEPTINDINGSQMLEATNATDSESESHTIEAFYEASSEINSEPESRVAANEIFHGHQAMETPYAHADAGHPFQAAETALVEPFQAVETGLETVNDVDNRVSQAELDSLSSETANELDAGDSPSTSSLRRFFASTISDLEDEGYSRSVRRRIG